MVFDVTLLQYLLIAVASLAAAIGVLWKFIERQTRIRDELIREIIKTQQLAMRIQAKNIANAGEEDDGA